MTAPNITTVAYDELSKRKKRGETTTEEHATCYRYYWQKALAMHELDADILVKLIYDANPLNKNLRSLVDMRNHTTEDNMKKKLSS